MDQVEKATEYIKDFYAHKISAKYAYHNLDHVLLVLNSVREICQKASLNGEDFVSLQIAALFHDTGFEQGPDQHEIRSAQIAEAYLLENGFENASIDTIKRCILATEMGASGTDTLTKILRDADMSGLASPDFFDITERLRKERNNTQSEHISKNKWNKINIEFLKDCEYATPWGKELYEDKKNANLEALIQKSKEKKQNKKEKVSTPTISTNKSAQTQFKTALRNHIDLSNIADNKANIMLSVNALILTVALPFLVDKSIDNTLFLLPTIVMSAVCLSSMIFATLSTRPIKMSGFTSQERIKSNQSNLFFFGNYHKMTYDEYKSGVDHVLSDNEALDDSIIRDLYFLGKSLGKKFEYLRLCYTIFMYGISVTVLAILVVYLGL